MGHTVDKFFEDRMIELSVSNYNSPLVLVKQPSNRDFRLCVNYIKLNKVLEHIYYPVPNIDTLMSDLYEENINLRFSRCFLECGDLSRITRNDVFYILWRG